MTSECKFYKERHHWQMLWIFILRMSCSQNFFIWILATYNIVRHVWYRMYRRTISYVQCWMSYVISYIRYSVTGPTILDLQYRMFIRYDIVCSYDIVCQHMISLVRRTIMYHSMKTYRIRYCTSKNTYDVVRKWRTILYVHIVYDIVCQLRYSMFTYYIVCWPTILYVNLDIVCWIQYRTSIYYVVSLTYDIVCQ